MELLVNIYFSNCLKSVDDWVAKFISQSKRSLLFSLLDYYWNQVSKKGAKKNKDNFTARWTQVQETSAQKVEYISVKLTLLGNVIVAGMF